MVVADITVRKLHLANKSDHAQRWEVNYDGEVIGWFLAHRIGQAKNTFFEAVGIAPDGESVVLDSHTVFENRVAVVLELHDDPERYRGVHWHPGRR